MIASQAEGIGTSSNDSSGPRICDGCGGGRWVVVTATHRVVRRTCRCAEPAPVAERDLPRPGSTRDR